MVQEVRLLGSFWGSTETVFFSFSSVTHWSGLKRGIVSGQDVPFKEVVSYSDFGIGSTCTKVGRAKGISFSFVISCSLSRSSII